MFLQCSDNNRASTVLNLFDNAGIAGSSHTIAKEMFEDFREVRSQKYLHLLNKLGSQWQQNCGTSKEPREV